jgi:hypothetical protein
MLVIAIDLKKGRVKPAISITRYYLGYNKVGVD